MYLSPFSLSLMFLLFWLCSLPWAIGIDFHLSPWTKVVIKCGAVFQENRTEINKCQWCHLLNIIWVRKFNMRNIFFFWVLWFVGLWCFNWGTTCIPPVASEVHNCGLLMIQISYCTGSGCIESLNSIRERLSN